MKCFPAPIHRVVACHDLNRSFHLPAGDSEFADGCTSEPALCCEVPDPQSAEALVDALPPLHVDWELVSDQDFRALLAALNFEASYNPTKLELTIRVTLVPELTDPDGPRAPLLEQAEIRRP